MSVVSFRVDKRLKARMDRLRHINWSELLRRYVESVVEQEERKLRSAKDPLAIKRAVEEMDRLAKISEGSGWIAEEEVIKWRRRRFSYSTQA
ncbi:MAG: VapB-type antitoxin [Nitrososphaerota archaeon]